MLIGNYYINYQTFKKVRKIEVISFIEFLRGFCSLSSNEKSAKNN
jgi:hypothetical protein